MFEDIQPPPAEPVTLEDIKLFLRIDHAEEDNLLLDLIRSAREQVERRAGVVMIARDVGVTLPSCGLQVRLPMSPVSDLVSVTQDGRDIPAQLDRRRDPAVLTLASGVDGFLHIVVRAGFGPDPQDVPVPLRQAVLLLVADAYEHRDDAPGFDRVSLRVDALIGPYWGPRL